ncbi:hypothetical protein Anas_01006 [Armadillidium nasatum]|uniref:Ig-like domain-containing protein n=1 Tax=Armadillidium nasatum TaxID=96803 RepID=A0A5N5TP47_9CRUS|nr:hypothetical protein Anas_01006 [Armadillidium nasatum]
MGIEENGLNRRNKWGTEFHYSENRKENWLEIFPLKVEDEGTYKCEITYLARGPVSFELTFEDGSLISNVSLSVAPPFFLFIPAPMIQFCPTLFILKNKLTQ